MPKGVERVLAAWRRAEQRLAGIREGSPAYAEAKAQAERWRERYQSLVNGSDSADGDQSMRDPQLPGLI